MGLIVQPGSIPSGWMKSSPCGCFHCAVLNKNHAARAVAWIGPIPHLDSPFPLGVAKGGVAFPNGSAHPMRPLPIPTFTPVHPEVMGKGARPAWLRIFRLAVRPSQTVGLCLRPHGPPTTSGCTAFTLNH